MVRCFTICCICTSVLHLQYNMYIIVIWMQILVSAIVLVLHIEVLGIIKCSRKCSALKTCFISFLSFAIISSGSHIWYFLVFLLHIERFFQSHFYDRIRESSRSFLGVSWCRGDRSSLLALIDGVGEGCCEESTDYYYIAYLNVVSFWSVISPSLLFFASFSHHLWHFSQNFTRNNKRRGQNILKRNLNNPSNVCAIPAIAAPIAEKNALIRPRIVLRIDWRTAMIELKVARIVLVIEEMSWEMDSTMEGMVAVVARVGLNMYFFFLKKLLNCKRDDILMFEICM